MSSVFLDADARCTDRVVPEVGYTHAADGTRLLDVFGRALSGDFVDDNQPSSFVPEASWRRAPPSSFFPFRRRAELLYYEKHCKYV